MNDNNNINTSYLTCLHDRFSHYSTEEIREKLIELAKQAKATKKNHKMYLYYISLIHKRVLHKDHYLLKIHEDKDLTYLHSIAKKIEFLIELHYRKYMKRYNNDINTVAEVISKEVILFN